MTQQVKLCITEQQSPQNLNRDKCRKLMLVFKSEAKALRVESLYFTLFKPIKVLVVWVHKLCSMVTDNSLCFFQSWKAENLSVLVCTQVLTMQHHHSGTGLSFPCCFNFNCYYMKYNNN